MRYIYPRTTLANFIELKFEEPPMRPAEFLELLSAVPGVLTVVPHPKSKAEQNNYGDHYQERNFLVYSQMYPKHGMEFELTKYNHENSGSTISACYKTQIDRPRTMEAWRILKHSVAGREFNAQVVEKIDTELGKLAGASDFTDTGQPRVSVSSCNKITVSVSNTSVGTSQWPPPPSVPFWAGPCRPIAASSKPLYLLGWAASGFGSVTEQADQVPQDIVMPDVGMRAQAQAQVYAQAEAQARAQAQAFTSSVQPHPPEPVVPEDRWPSPPSNDGNEHLKPRDVTQPDLARLFETVSLDGWEWRYIVL